MIGIVTGLSAEARLAAPLGHALAGGGTAAGAARAARELIAHGATALISFGLAGGLNPKLPPGTIIIPDRLCTATGNWRTDATLTRALGGPAHALFGGVVLAVTAEEKRCLFETIAADAVDLESGAVAATAAAAGIPFAMLRAVCDPAERSLPPAAIAALDHAGAIAPLRVALSVVRQPRQIPALLALARDAAAARRALIEQVRNVSPLTDYPARSSE